MQTSGVQNRSTVSIRHLRHSLLQLRWCLDILWPLLIVRSSRKSLTSLMSRRSLWSLSLSHGCGDCSCALSLLLLLLPYHLRKTSVASGGRRGGKTDIVEVEEDDNDMKERYRKEDMQARTSQERVKRKKCPNLNLDASAEMYSISGIDVRFHLGVLGRGSLLLLWVPIYYSNNCSE